MIGIYFLTGEPVSPELPAVLKTEIPFSGQTAEIDFTAYLGEQGIDWTDAREMPCSTSMKVGVNVVTTFTEGLLNSLIACDWPRGAVSYPLAGFGTRKHTGLEVIRIGK